MSEETIEPRGSIDKYVLPYIGALPDMSGMIAIDIPSGEGRASGMLARRGAAVRAFDLYPEFTNIEGVRGEYADMNDAIPVDDAEADFLICQEGIEHMPDKIALFREFNRVLKVGGTLVVTTPNLSNARGRMWMALAESDSGRRMPVSEIDSLWFTEEESDRLYFGHLFLTTVQQLQTICSITGFELVQRRKTAWSTSAVVFGVLMYPFLVLGSLFAYFSYRDKNRHIDKRIRERIFRERIRLNLSPQTLFGKHMFWVLRKNKSVAERIAELKAFAGNET
ncbi:MAG: class I SAM-dependent methyltransferase [Woeseiaceae bacterium]|nr:class I SAM-dependent methyltransferase [Woeseiaceae bacterium]